MVAVSGLERDFKERGAIAVMEATADPSSALAFATEIAEAVQSAIIGDRSYPKKTVMNEGKPYEIDWYSGLTRGRRPIILIEGQRKKVCECNNCFPVEYNSRGQMTSRQLCDPCREKRTRRRADDLPNTEGVPRCFDCSALVGLEWGTVTHLDHDSRCPSCAEWYLKRLDREHKERQGIFIRGGIQFKAAR